MLVNNYKQDTEYFVSIIEQDSDFYLRLTHFLKNYQKNLSNNQTEQTDFSFENKTNHDSITSFKSILDVIKSSIDPSLLADIIEYLDASFDQLKLAELNTKIDSFEKFERKLSELEQEVLERNSMLKEMLNRIDRKLSWLSDNDQLLFKNKKLENSHLFVYKFMNFDVVKNKKEPTNAVEEMLCAHEELILETDYIEQLIHRINKDKQQYENKYFEELLLAIAEFHDKNIDLFKKVIHDFFNLLAENSRIKRETLNNLKTELNKQPVDKGIKFYLENNFANQDPSSLFQANNQEWLMEESNSLLLNSFFQPNKQEWLMEQTNSLLLSEMCGIEFSNSAESVRPSLRINDQLNENFNSTNRKAKHAKNSNWPEPPLVSDYREEIDENDAFSVVRQRLRCKAVCAQLIVFFCGFCEEFRVRWQDFEDLLKFGNEYYEKVVKLRANLYETEFSAELTENEKYFRKTIRQVLGRIKVANSWYTLDNWYGSGVNFGQGEIEQSKMKAHIDQFLNSECQLVLIDVDGLPFPIVKRRKDVLYVFNFENITPLNSVKRIKFKGVDRAEKMVEYFRKIYPDSSKNYNYVYLDVIPYEPNQSEEHSLSFQDILNDDYNDDYEKIFFKHMSHEGDVSEFESFAINPQEGQYDNELDDLVSINLENFKQNQKNEPQFILIIVLQNGIENLRKRNFEKAIKFFTKIYHENSHSEHSKLFGHLFELNEFLLCVTLIKFKKYDSSLKILEKIPTLSSKYLQGYIYSKLGQNEKTKETFRLALQAQSITSNILINKKRIQLELGLAYFHAKELDEAIDWFKLCMTELFFVAAENSVNLNLLMYDENSYLIRETCFYIGLVYNQKKEFKMAITPLTKSIQMSENENNKEPILFQLGVSYAELKEWDNAVSNLLKVIIINPENFECHYALGLVYIERNQIDLAIQSLLKCLEHKPDAFNKLAWLYMNKKKDPNSAIKLFNRMEQLNSNQPTEFFFERGLCYLKKLSHPLCRNDFEKVISKTPTNAELNERDKQLLELICKSHLKNALSFTTDINAKLRMKKAFDNLVKCFNISQQIKLFERDPQLLAEFRQYWEKISDQFIYLTHKPDEKMEVEKIKSYLRKIKINKPTQKTK